MITFNRFFTQFLKEEKIQEQEFSEYTFKNVDRDTYLNTENVKNAIINQQGDISILGLPYQFKFEKLINELTGGRVKTIVGIEKNQDDLKKVVIPAAKKLEGPQIYLPLRAMELSMLKGETEFVNAKDEEIKANLSQIIDETGGFNIIDADFINVYNNANKQIISNLKNYLKPNGLLFLTFSVWGRRAEPELKPLIRHVDQDKNNFVFDDERRKLVPNQGTQAEREAAERSLKKPPQQRLYTMKMISEYLKMNKQTADDLFKSFSEDPIYGNTINESYTKFGITTKDELQKQFFNAANQVIEDIIKENKGFVPLYFNVYRGGKADKKGTIMMRIILQYDSNMTPGINKEAKIYNLNSLLLCGGMTSEIASQSVVKMRFSKIIADGLRAEKPGSAIYAELKDLCEKDEGKETILREYMDDLRNLIFPKPQSPKATFSGFLRKSKPGKTYVFSPNILLSSLRRQLSIEQLPIREFDVETTKKDGKVYATKITRKEKSAVAEQQHQHQRKLANLAELAEQMRQLTGDDYIDLSNFVNNLPTITQFRGFLQRAKLSAADFNFYTQDKERCTGRECIIKYIGKSAGAFSIFLRNSKLGDTYVFDTPPSIDSVASAISRLKLSGEFDLEKTTKDGKVYVTKITRKEKSADVKQQPRFKFAELAEQMRQLSGDDYIDLSNFFVNKLPTMAYFRAIVLKDAGLSAFNFVFYTPDKTVCSGNDCILKYIKKGSGSFKNWLMSAKPGDSFTFKKPTNRKNIQTYFAHYNLDLSFKLFTLETTSINGETFVTKITKNRDANVQGNIDQPANNPRSNVLHYADRETNNLLTDFYLNGKIGDSLNFDPPLSIKHFNSYVGTTRARGRAGLSKEKADGLGAGMFKFKFSNGNITKIKKVKEYISPQAGRSGEILIDPKKIENYTMQNEKLVLRNFKDFFNETMLI